MSEPIFDSRIDVALNKSYTISTYKLNEQPYGDTTPRTKLTDGNDSGDAALSVGWEGSEGEVLDVDITIDLEEIKTHIGKVSILSKTHEYYYPNKIMVFTSIDGIKWVPNGHTSIDIGGQFDILFKKKAIAKYVKIIARKLCTNPRLVLYLSSVKIYQIRNNEPRTFKRVKAYPGSDGTDPYGCDVYDGYAYLSEYFSNNIYKVRLNPNPRLISTTASGVTGSLGDMVVIPNNNHLLVNSNNGSLKAYNLDTMELEDDNSTGNLPHAVDAQKNWGNINFDDEYLYLISCYDARLFIRNIDDYTEAVPDFQLDGTKIFGFPYQHLQNHDLDFLLCQNGEDQGTPGAIYKIFKNDWSIEKVVDLTSYNQEHYTATDDYIVALQSNAIELYSHDGVLEHSHSTPSRISNLAVVDNNLLFSTFYTAQYKNFYTLNLNDPNSVQLIGQSNGSFNGKYSIKDKTFVSQEDLTGHIVLIKF